MSVVWADGFYFKHIVVVGDALAFTEMVTQGIKIYNDRLKGTGDNEKAVGKVKKGLIAGGNTLVIVGKSGFEQMTSWVEANGVHGAKVGTNTIPIQSGAIVQAHDTEESVKLGSGGGTIRVGIKVTGAEKNVYHLEGYTMANGLYTAAQAVERQDLIFEKLAGPAKHPTSPDDLKKLIRIIDGFAVGQ